MPYLTGQTPLLGDHVENMAGRSGKITSVALNQGNLQGEDAVRIQWDDGGIGTGMAVASEFKFLRRPDPSESATFLSLCPHCNERRSVSGDRDCLKVSAEKNEPIKVMSIICGHSWELGEQEKQNLHKGLKAGTI